MPTAKLGFGEINFGQAELGDERRGKRLVDLANRLSAHPEGTLPNKLKDPAAYQAMYRLCKNPKVTHKSVLKPHCQLVLEKMREHKGVVLVIHDTTELDYTSIKLLHDQLGPIGDGGGRGFECHNSIAVIESSGQLLGLSNQILHKRAEVPENEGVAAKRERENRESRLWVLGSEAVGPVPNGCQWVDICDRGADTFEFLDFEALHNKSYVIRSSYNRAIFSGHQDHSERALLHDYVRSVDPIGGRSVHVPARAGQRSRQAKCLISLVPVQLIRPHVRRGKFRNEPLSIWVIRIWEIDAPTGVEPLEWILLTNIPTHTLEEAITRICWYEKRWIIEDYHKAKKTGCGIEGLQFQRVDRLEPMIALLSVIATTLVNLRVANRLPDAERTLATAYVPVIYVKVLSVWRFKERRADLTVREFTMALARLGGHQNRSSDGPPGWITLWRGWNELQQMVDYATAAAGLRSD